MRGAKDTHTVPRISVCRGTTGGREEEDDDDERTERNGRTGEELGDKRERERERETEENVRDLRWLAGVVGSSRSGRRSRVSERGVKHGSRGTPDGRDSSTEECEVG